MARCHRRDIDWQRKFHYLITSESLSESFGKGLGTVDVQPISTRPQTEAHSPGSLSTPKINIATVLMFDSERSAIHLAKVWLRDGFPAATLGSQTPSAHGRWDPVRAPRGAAQYVDGGQFALCQSGPASARARCDVYSPSRPAQCGSALHRQQMRLQGGFLLAATRRSTRYTLRRERGANRSSTGCRKPALVRCCRPTRVECDQCGVPCRGFAGLC